ncbi:Potassium voltage-gated channel subfamily KQT member 5 [Porphyridium purpureum]|uniref:Potassium voltage-gated channel subfamily KQT member 5 n=1 Tax=Porphyridium purpureum TaxID=35688 RepID=A0A5J4Z468_PORPP|nr:Potassium voltage-gated channel subfamily KQT member 5 [Porphyridium purpureum]|eukprot:POR3585..scf295_1
MDASTTSRRADRRTMRAKMYELVDGEFDSWAEYAMMVLIVLNVVMFVVGTLVVDDGSKASGKPGHDMLCVGTKRCVTLSDAFVGVFSVFEIVSVALFSLEYVLRLWCCVENEQEYGRHGPVLGRLKYMSNGYALIDLFAILPFYLALFGVIRHVRFSTTLRALRLARLLKAEKYLQAFSLLEIVLKENGTLLVACAYYAGIVLMVFSVIMYYLERYNPETAVYFQSIPDSMFPTLVMLTGEFPITEFTTPGRIVAACIALAGVAFFAIPTAVIGSGFIRAVEEHDQFMRARSE